MAVPKKRTSKTKTRVRKTIWKKKAEKQVSRLLSKINKLEKKKPCTQRVQGFGPLRAASMKKKKKKKKIIY